MSTYSLISHHGPAQTLGDGAFFEQNGWLPVPRLVQWMVTLRCPLSCPHCLAEDDQSPEMSLEQSTNLIRQVAEMQVPEFLLTGGEPLARPDMPEILAALRENHVRWSLNTAVMPDKRLQKAIEDWPPVFVAVSLDGPASVHNRFRGHAESYDQAIESIGYFASFGIEVAAGTTVTSRNYDLLGETFSIVLSSGASRWGLHLLVPEGRAADRKELFLSCSQLKGLLAFATDKRKYFSVTMADEIGYCGGWEPLVRDAPFFCGAGRAGCVVLPDGEVVPCTTLDRTTSAGNIHHRPLRQIWETGFADLRKYRSSGKCVTCGYASACHGGCWLQRKNGTHCYRQVWLPEQMKKLGRAAALVGVASGTFLAAGPNDVLAQSAPAEETERTAPADTNFFRAPIRLPSVLDTAIVNWYTAEALPKGRRTLSIADIRAMLKAEMGEDPGAAYLVSWMEGDMENDLSTRVANIRSALETQEPSLCLLALIWRDIAEWCLDAPAAAKRTDREQAMLAQLLNDLSQKAELWQAEQLRLNLHPFMGTEGQIQQHFQHFLISKAYMPSKHATSILHRSRVQRDADENQLVLRPFGSALTFNITFAEAKPIPIDTTRTTALKGDQDTETYRMRLFDAIAVKHKEEGEAPIPVTVSWSGRDTSTFTLDIVLPEGVLLTHADIICLADEQHGQRLAQHAETMASRGNPFGLPALHRAVNHRALLNLYLF